MHNLTVHTIIAITGSKSIPEGDEEMCEGDECDVCDFDGGIVDDPHGEPHACCILFIVIYVVVVSTCHTFPDTNRSNLILCSQDLGWNMV